MVRRKLLARWVTSWSAFCLWAVRRAPLPPDRTLRLLNFCSAVTGLPRPCPVGRRAHHDRAAALSSAELPRR
jgi:hypothetical protein